jgi:hypothetical protein
LRARARRAALANKAARLRYRLLQFPAIAAGVLDQFSAVDWKMRDGVVDRREGNLKQWLADFVVHIERPMALSDFVMHEQFLRDLQRVLFGGVFVGELGAITIGDGGAVMNEMKEKFRHSFRSAAFSTYLRAANGTATPD